MEQIDFPIDQMKHCNLSDMYHEKIMGRRYDRLYNRFVELAKVKPHDHVFEARWHTKVCAFKLMSKAPVIVFSVDAGAVRSLRCPEKALAPSHDTVRAFPMENQSMDVVTAFKVYSRLTNKRAFRSEAYRLLKPDGRLYICDPRSWAAMRNIKNALFRLCGLDLRLCDTETMKADFVDAGFRFVEATPIGHMQMLVFRK